MAVKLGARVRIYADDDNFDEGVVFRVSGDGVDVEFFDWQQRWPVSDLHEHFTWPDQQDVPMSRDPR